MWLPIACETAAVLAWLGFLTIGCQPTFAGTDPVGFETITIHGDTHNLVAQRLHPFTVATGTITAVSGADVTDSSADFDAALPIGVPCVFEQDGAPHAVIDIVSHSATTLTLAADGIVAVGDTYHVRPLQKLSEILSPVLYPDFNPVEDFDPDTGDLVMIPKPGGGFSQYYYSAATGYEGYYNAGTGAEEDPYIRYTDSLLIERRGADFYVVFSGEIKVTDAAIPIDRRFNHVGSVAPVSSLASLGLAETVRAGDPGTADIVWSQDETTGDFLKFFYSDGSAPGLTTGWRMIGGGDLDRGTDFVSTGLVIRRRGVLPHVVIMKAPALF